MMKLDLLPEVDAEGKKWRFLGLKSKNRQEWLWFHTANYHCGTTSIALYDTLGPDATNYIINQTQMATIATSKDLVKGVLKLKADD